MSIRIFTRDNENLKIKEEILEKVRTDNNPFIANIPLWKLDPQKRLTLFKPRYTEKAFFRIIAHPGSGMVQFDLEEPDDAYIEADIYATYHDTLHDYLNCLFPNRFYLLQRTPYEPNPLRPSQEDPKLLNNKYIYALPPGCPYI